MRTLRGLYAITPQHPGEGPPGYPEHEGQAPPDTFMRQVELAIAGGARVIQYRDKSSDLTRDWNRRLGQAQALRDLCRATGVALIVNDDIGLAAAVCADGVHLGRDDPALADARRLLGDTAIIGVSCYNRLDLAEEAQAAGADYVAFGSFFASSTKPLAVRADLGLLRLARRRIHLPLVAIGGITPENGAALIAAGADLLAVVSGVFAGPDPKAAAQRYARLFDTPNLKDAP